MARKSNSPEIKLSPSQKKKRTRYALLFLLILILVVVELRPGVYTVQPVDAIPEGMTFIYVLRQADQPLYTSFDPECFYSPTSVSLICNAMLKSDLENLSGRIILKLPYNHSAYLKGSNGIEPGYIED
jgi:hypothetical protein